MVVTGKDTTVIHTIEDNFAESPSDAFDPDPSGDGYVFGANVTLGTNEGSNNAERVFRPNSRQAEHIVEQQFDGSFSVDFNLASPWFLSTVFGSPDTDGGGPYDHEYKGKFPNSFQILEQTDFPGSRVDHRYLRGCVVSSVDVDVSTEGLAEISLDGAYADETLETKVNSSGTYTSNVPISQPKSDRPFHFGQAKFKLSRDPQNTNPTEEGRVQDASLSLEGNVDMVYELGTRLGVDFSPKALEPDLSYTRLVTENDDSDLQDMYGIAEGSRGDPGTFGPEDPTMGEDDFVFWLEFTDGTGNKIVKFICTGGLTDSLSKNNVGDPESEIEHDLDRLVNEVKVVATNQTSSAPY